MTAQLDPNFFVEKLIVDTEKNQIDPVRQYFVRNKGRKVAVGSTEPFKSYISDIEKCLSDTRNYVEQLSIHKQKEFIYNQYIKCAESVHRLLYNSELVDFLNLGESLGTDLSQELPAYIFENPNTTEDPSKFIEKLLQEKRTDGLKTVTISTLINEITSSFTNCEQKNRTVADFASTAAGAGAGVAAGTATGVAAGIGTSIAGSVAAGVVGGAATGPGAIVCVPVGILGGLAVGIFGAHLTKNKTHEKISNWYHNLIASLSSFLRNRIPNTQVLLKELREKDTHEHVTEIRKDILGWVNKTNEKLSAVKGVETHFDILALQLEHMWSLAKAVLTQKPESLQEHTRRFERLIDATKVLNDNAQLVVSIGYNQQNGQKIPVMSLRKIPQDVVMTVNQTQINGWWFSTSSSTDYTSVVRNVLDKYAELQKAKIVGIFIGDFSLKQLHSNVLNEKFNRYYQINSERASMVGTFALTKWQGELKDVYSRGQKPYFCPKGWHRISLNVARDRAEFDKNYANWPIAYHGTKGKIALDILVSGLRTGTGVVLGQNRTGGLVYLSPSIIYTAHPRY